MFSFQSSQKSDGEEKKSFLVVLIRVEAVNGSKRVFAQPQLPRKILGLSTEFCYC